MAKDITHDLWKRKSELLIKIRKSTQHHNNQKNSN